MLANTFTIIVWVNNMAVLILYGKYMLGIIIIVYILHTLNSVLALYSPLLRIYLLWKRISIQTICVLPVSCDDPSIILF